MIEDQVHNASRSPQLGSPKCWTYGHSYDSCCPWRGASFNFDEVLYKSSLSASQVRADSMRGGPAAPKNL